jgi:type IV secretion system protein VirB10
MSGDRPREAPQGGGAAPPAAITLNRRLVLAVAAAGALILAVAAAVALQAPPAREAADRVPRPAYGPLPRALAALPASYGDPERIAPYLQGGAAAQPSPDELARLAQMEAQAAALQKQLEDALARIAQLQQQPPPPPPPPPAAPPPVDVDAQAAATSGLFFAAGAPAGFSGGGAPRPTRAGGPLAGEPPPEPVRTAARGDAAGMQQIPPLSVAAGTVIPASLITGINSDLTGPVIAQVRENVYDTLTGTHLLIPQGSRLLGSYGADVVYGQDRVRAAFTRLTRPDGTWVSLANAEASDTTGMAGLADEVDNHWGKLIAGALITATFSLGVTASQGTPNGYYPSPAQSAAANAAGSIGQTGAAFAQRQLDQKPTITVRPGFSFDIIVVRDMLLPAYAEPGIVIPVRDVPQ